MGSVVHRSPSVADLCSAVHRSITRLPSLEMMISSESNRIASPKL
jgi:hypothetical protein